MGEFRAVIELNCAPLIPPVCGPAPTTDAAGVNAAKLIKKTFNFVLINNWVHLIRLRRPR